MLQIETLCVILGATVVDNEDRLTFSDPAVTRLIIVPASMSTNSFLSIAQQGNLLTNPVLVHPSSSVTTLAPNQVVAVRSSWLTESISARLAAPVEDYSYGVLTLL